MIEHFPQAETWLAAFGISDVAQISDCARALFGEIPVRGHLPVTVPGVDLKAGFGIEVPANPMKLAADGGSRGSTMKPAYDVIEKAIADKAFPGATLAVGYQGKVALHAFGKLSYDAKSPQVQMRTMYDIASLTKVVVTTTLVEKLVEGDFPSPLIWMRRSSVTCRNGPAGRSRSGGSRVTVRHLMTHTSGLPPFKEYWRTSKGKRTRCAGFLPSRWSTSRERRWFIRTWELS